MFGKLNSKRIGISTGIFTCFYLMYTQNLLLFQVESLAAKTKNRQMMYNPTNGDMVATAAKNIGVKRSQKMITIASDETVLTEVSGVGEFVDVQPDLRTLPTNQYLLFEVFWKYINTFQYLCKYQLRFGPRGDTGYEVCEDETYRPGKPCILYSFGSYFMFGFEKDIMKYHQCEVHTFDPSFPIAGHFIPHGINFHLVGLGDNVTTNSKGWKMQTFADFRRTLNHSKKTIDILKIDIEGGEWVALAQTLKSDELRFVKQLQIELHLWGKDRVGMALVGKLTVLKNLYEHGFRIFMHERYWTKECERQMRPPHPEITLCVILSFVNTKYHPY